MRNKNKLTNYNFLGLLTYTPNEKLTETGFTLSRRETMCEPQGQLKPKIKINTFLPVSPNWVIFTHKYL